MAGQLTSLSLCRFQDYGPCLIFKASISEASFKTTQSASVVEHCLSYILRRLFWISCFRCDRSSMQVVCLTIISCKLLVVMVRFIVCTIEEVCTESGTLSFLNKVSYRYVYFITSVSCTIEQTPCISFYRGFVMHLYLHIVMWLTGRVIWNTFSNILVYDIGHKT